MRKSTVLILVALAASAGFVLGRTNHIESEPVSRGERLNVDPASLIYIDPTPTADVPRLKLRVYQYTVGMDAVIFDRPPTDPARIRLISTNDGRLRIAAEIVDE